MKWLFVDFLCCVGLAQLRIPRLHYAKSIVFLQIMLLWLVDGFLFGGIVVDFGLGSAWDILPHVRFSSEYLYFVLPSDYSSGSTSWSTGSGDVVSTAPTFSITDLIPGLGFAAFLGSGGRDSHLLGQHTVRMSPISTAQLNPFAQTFCIASPNQHILVPVLLNNTNPAGLKYTLTPLGYIEDASTQDKSKAVGKIERGELSAKDLKAIEHARQESLQVARSTASAKRDSDEYDDYEDDDEEEEVLAPYGHSSLQKSQTLIHVRVTKPGILRLEQVMDSSNVEARLVYPTDIPIVPCPRASFSDASAVPQGRNVRCAAPGLRSGAGEELEMKIDIYGVPPLSLRWYRDINGKQEPFMVEGIEEEDRHVAASGDKRRLAGAGRRAPQQLSIPLTATLDSLGTHTYVLESVSDALGNIVSAGASSGTSHDQTTRTVSVLRRPSVSFKYCDPGHPSPLLIGSDTRLMLGVKDADEADGPWDIDVKYTPAVDESDPKAKKVQPWKKTMTTEPFERDIILRAIAPGEYSVTGVKGQYCEGDVLSPESCKVAEKPLPTAEIEWKKIHEW